ncbi:MAG: tetratricopeptide repeat protein [Phycisphaerales bacterium]|nr:tetratricopeptide repeat protein [Phycisphaerales bacterium]
MTEWFEAEDHASRALDMFERGRWAEAEVELRMALAVNPDQPEWLYNLGIVLEYSGRDRQARDVFERAAALAPDQVEVVTSAAIACARLGDSDRALKWCDRALKVDPRNEDAHARRIEMLVGQGRHDEAETAFYLAEMAMDEPSPLCLLEIAVSLITRGQYRRAGWCLREAMRMEPGLPRIRLRLAEVHASTGRLDRAIQLCSREVREDPGNVEALAIYAGLLEAADRRVEATDMLRRVIDFDPANVNAHESLGHLLARMGRHEQALLELQIVRKLDPGHPGVDLALGEVEVRLGRPDAARLSLLRAYERCCDQIGQVGADPMELAHVAAMLLKVGLAEEAVVLLEAASETRTTDVDLMKLLARARYQSGDCRGGMAMSRAVLRLEAGCLASIHNLALGALHRGRLRIAAAWVRRGLHLDPGDEGLRRIRLRLWLARVTRLGGRSSAWAQRWLQGQG